MAARTVIGATVKAVSRQGKFAARKAALTLTPSAVQKIKSLMSTNSDAVGLRVGVRQRGCNGLSYTLEFAKEKGKFDEIVTQDGVKVLIDSKAQLSLLGTEMDFVENKLSSEFVFHNPNIKGTCGCGESFNV
ncbi:iron-sulfur cluster assembly 1 homolog, mitochondrial-like [Actinia tenebrosa]|uniref:Iron-sulfur cluster assembly 1 homolog, mitochondrial n=1 Tax=Actinia tenebrosa TaxID=6105 RepID=A0A6P8JA72_ACTTE|nr:iron-sulfur cluster assembly 1 homolog, mitochondrial-like [Actinia tenebrosa]